MCNIIIEYYLIVIMNSARAVRLIDSCSHWENVYVRTCVCTSININDFFISNISN